MTLFPIVLFASIASAQPNPNGEPSAAVQQQQKQADYASKQHPHSGKPHGSERTPLRTKGAPVKPPKPKPGEAPLRIPSK